MQSFVIPYALFAAKALTVIVLLLAFAAALAAIARAARGERRDQLEIVHVNDRIERLAEAVRSAIEPQQRKSSRLERRRERRRKREAASRPRVFVLDFKGDIAASGVEALRVEVSTLLQVARAEDEILLRLESAGGTVHGYGLAAAQLRRLRDRGLPLIVAVDRVAASGGYMMACVGDRILAAPFAIIGSIGVVAQLPNFHRLLQKNDIDFELHTAGAFKRTLTLFGENTEAARDKFREELDEAHALFKAFIGENRSRVPLDTVATGEHWYGRRALELQLVDELRTSDDYLLSRIAEREVYEISYKPQRRFAQRLLRGVARMLRRAPEMTAGFAHALLPRAQ